jgi:enamine deaminase RidA (YjgF/YER057c/UK114 family)
MSDEPVTVEHVSVDGQPDTAGKLQYSQAVRVGDLVFVAGQPGWDERFRAPEDEEAEYERLFANLAVVLAAAGCGLGDVVDAVSLHASGADLGLFWQVRNRHLAAPWPAWTTIEDVKLALPGLRAEVKVTAVVR